MDRRTLLAGGAAAAGLVILGAVFLAPVSDEELIAQVLDELADGISFSQPIGNAIFYGSRLSEVFKEVLADQVDIRVSEVASRLPSHRGQLGMAAAQVLQAYGSLDVSFGSVKAQVSGETARVSATASVTALGGGQLRTDTRRVEFQFTKADGDWKIASAFVHRAD